MTDALKPQADKFRDMARELECDEDATTFEDNLRRIVRSQEKPDGPRKEDGDQP